MGDELVKVLVIGETLVGKTTFIHRYVNNGFRDEYKSTIGVDFALKNVRFKDKNLKLQMWDIAGQERFTFMTRAYYKDAKGCLLMFDISDPKTFAKVPRWKFDLDSKVRNEDGSNLPCVLIANKTDLPNTQVTREQIVQICKEHGFVGWMEISVKDNIMVQESVRYLLDVIFSKKGIPADEVDIMQQSISLHKRHPTEDKSRCVCKSD